MDERGPSLMHGIAVRSWLVGASREVLLGSRELKSGAKGLCMLPPLDSGFFVDETILLCGVLIRHPHRPLPEHSISIVRDGRF